MSEQAVPAGFDEREKSTGSGVGVAWQSWFWPPPDPTRSTPWVTSVRSQLSLTSVVDTFLPDWQKKLMFDAVDVSPELNRVCPAVVLVVQPYRPAPVYRSPSRCIMKNVVSEPASRIPSTFPL